MNAVGPLGRSIRRPVRRAVVDHLGFARLQAGERVEHDHPLGHLVDRPHLVRHHHHRHAVSGKLAHHVEHVAHEFRVER